VNRRKQKKSATSIVAHLKNLAALSRSPLGEGAVTTHRALARRRSS
jgi:hypothetical protein